MLRVVENVRENARLQVYCWALNSLLMAASDPDTAVEAARELLKTSIPQELEWTERTEDE
jgi:hypothetical protein